MVDQMLLWRHPRLPAEGIMILDLAQNFQHIPAFFRELRRYLDRPPPTGHTRAQDVFRHLRIIRTVEGEKGAGFGLTDANIPVYLAHSMLKNADKTAVFE